MHSTVSVRIKVYYSQMPTRITATELARSLSDILSRIKYRGEEFLVERNGEPLATLAPVAPPGVTLRGFIQRLGDLRMPEGMADDLERIQAEQPRAVFPEWPNS